MNAADAARARAIAAAAVRGQHQQDDRRGRRQHHAGHHHRPHDEEREPVRRAPGVHVGHAHRGVHPGVHGHRLHARGFPHEVEPGQHGHRRQADHRRQAIAADDPLER